MLAGVLAEEYGVGKGKEIDVGAPADVAVGAGDGAVGVFFSSAAGGSSGGVKMPRR